MTTSASRRGHSGRKHVFAGKSMHVPVSLPIAVATRINGEFAPGSSERMRILRAALMGGLNAAGYVNDHELDSAS